MESIFVKISAMILMQIKNGFLLMVRVIMIFGSLPYPKKFSRFLLPFVWLIYPSANTNLSYDFSKSHLCN